MPTHLELVTQAAQAVANTDPDAITQAFVGSLSTRNLPARSAFGSYVVLQNFVAHEFRSSEQLSKLGCFYCGLSQETKRVETDERVLNYPFQAHHTSIQYSAYDLSSFERRHVDKPGAKDLQMLGDIFASLRSLPAEAQLADLIKSLQGKLPGNKLERMKLLETFGYAGILCPRDQDHYSDGFVTSDDANSRQPAEFYKREWAYPVRFWTGKDGVDEDLVTKYFGKYL